LLERKEKLPLEMVRESGKSVAPCCLHRGFLKFGPCVGEGNQESRVEWSFDISLQEHIHHPAKGLVAF
jgi:hypothetical protein